MYTFNYVYRGRDKNAFYFAGFMGWREYDCPDYDYVRVVRLIRVYTYPLHSPCYYLKTKHVYYKNGVKVSSYITAWTTCKVKDLLASYDSMSHISDVCGIRLYRGAWV